MAIITVDPRLIPILTRGNVAALIDANTNDVRRWTSGNNPPVQRGHALGPSSLVVPFVGLVEADLIQHLARTGLSARRVNSILRSMRTENGELAVVDHPELVTDGSDLFIKEGSNLTRTRDSQTTHNVILADWLRHLKIDKDGKVTEYYPDRLSIASINPRFNGGKLSLTDSRIPVWVIVDEFQAGSSAEQIAKDYQIPRSQVEAIIDDLTWAEAAAA